MIFERAALLVGILMVAAVDSGDSPLERGMMMMTVMIITVMMMMKVVMMVTVKMVANILKGR